MLQPEEETRKVTVTLPKAMVDLIAREYGLPVETFIEKAAHEKCLQAFGSDGGPGMEAAEPPLSDEVFEKVEALLRMNRIIAATKLLRNHGPLGLKESLRVVKRHKARMSHERRQPLGD